MRRFIFLCAISRSGHTAIKNWIGYQCPSPAYMLNWVGQILEYKKNEQLIDIRPSDRYIINNILKTRYTTFKFLNELFELEKDFTVVVNCENVVLSEKGLLGFFHKDKRILDFIKDQCEITHVLSIRDPYNNFSSFLETNPNKCINNDAATKFNNTYYEYIKEIEEINNFPNKILINYNNWVISENYRKLIAKKLKIVFTDDGFLQIGSRSGFDNAKYQGKTNEMKVLERWKTFKNNDFFKKIIDQKMFHDFSLKHFGFYLDFSNPNEAVAKYNNQFKKI